MMDTPLSQHQIQTIHKQLRKGIPAGEIKAQLQAEGYSNAVIEKAINKPTGDMRNWYLFFGSIFFVAGLFTVALYGSFLLLIGGVVMLVVWQQEKNRIKNVDDDQKKDPPSAI